MELFDYQKEAIQLLRDGFRNGHKAQMLYMPTGCHDESTNILMADGSFRACVDIVDGDRLASPTGDDFRTVKSLHRGRGAMYRITPMKGEPFIVNGGHVLSLAYYYIHNVSGKRVTEQTRVCMTVDEYLAQPKSQKHLLKLWRPDSVHFEAHSELLIDPWALGALLGDGSLRNCTMFVSPDDDLIEAMTHKLAPFGVTPTARYRNNCWHVAYTSPRGQPNEATNVLRELGVHGCLSIEKFVPDAYKFAGRDVRLAVLAGLLDTDGSLGHGGYDYISGSRRLSEDVVFLARSCGLAAYLKECTKSCQNDHVGTYWRVSVSGDTDKIPMVCARKKAAQRKQKKRVTVTGFTVERVNDDYYYGFELDGDRLYMTSDFVVHHNSGKSVCAVDMIASAEAKGTRVAFLTERTALTEQFSRHLDRAGINHGIKMADHWRSRPHERVQVCSQQTLESRGWPNVDLIVVDEAQIARKQVMAWLDRTDARVVGLSATPFTKGLGLTYTNLVSPVTTNELIARNRLVPLKVFAGVEADLRGAKKTASEWQAGDVASRSMSIVGNITAEWVKHAHLYGDPRQFKTFLFSPTVDYGEMLCEQFNKLGYRFEQISYRDNNHERRERLLAELNDTGSDLCGIVSVDALGRGVDVPNVRCVDMCRPFRKSFMAFVQQLGRGMRVADGKESVCVLDHAGNCLRFGDDLAYLFEHGCTSLDDGRLQDGVRKEKTRKEKKDILCSCGAVIFPWDDKCPSCGKVRQRKLSVVENVPGELRELELAQRRNNTTSADEKKAWMEAMRTYGQTHGYKPGWAQHKYKDRFGHYYQGECGYGPVFPEAMGWIKHTEIKYRNRKRA